MVQTRIHTLFVRHDIEGDVEFVTVRIRAEGRKTDVAQASRGGRAGSPVIARAILAVFAAAGWREEGGGAVDGKGQPVAFDAGTAALVARVLGGVR